MSGNEEPGYQVVINDERQYSVWPDDRDLPRGWSAVGVHGGKDACLDHIARTWTDMRPASLAARMSGDAGNASTNRE